VLQWQCPFHWFECCECATLLQSTLGVLYQHWDRVSRFYRSVSIEIVECADEGYTVPISWVWPERECYALIRDESS